MLDLHVERAVWHGKVGALKTKASRAPVPIIKPLQKLLTEYRWKCGEPQGGFMFPTRNGTPIDQPNLVDRVILPALNVCLHCGEGPNEKHVHHTYERDPRRPEWRGWHAFRRGLATTLHASGEADQRTQDILRHANVRTTQKCYIKSVPAATRKAMHSFGEIIADNAECRVNQDSNCLI